MEYIHLFIISCLRDFFFFFFLFFSIFLTEVICFVFLTIRNERKKFNSSYFLLFFPYKLHQPSSPLYSYSPHNLPTIFNSCVPYILQTTISNNICKYLFILYLLEGELHLLSSYFSFYNVHVDMF